MPVSGIPKSAKVGKATSSGIQTPAAFVYLPVTLLVRRNAC